MHPKKDKIKANDTLRDLKDDIKGSHGVREAFGEMGDTMKKDYEETKEDMTEMKDTVKDVFTDDENKR